MGVCYPRFDYVWPIIPRLYTLYFHLLPYTARPVSGRQDRHRVQRLILVPTARRAQKECEICRGRRVAEFTLLILITVPPEERKRKCTYVDSERGAEKKRPIPRGGKEAEADNYDRSEASVPSAGRPEEITR